ncbi:MAG: maltotransferase domain-containing protein, partial [Phycisphaerales bacterium]
MSDFNNIEGQKRVVIENVRPQIDNGLFAVKRVIDEKVIVKADIFADGHDHIDAELLYRHQSSGNWQRAKMEFVVNDEWTGTFRVE